MNKNLITGEMANLVKGLEKAAETLGWELRHEKKVPDLLDLLVEANYITKETREWIKRELILQEIPIEKLLLANYLASEDTINNAIHLLNTLQTLI